MSVFTSFINDPLLFSICMLALLCFLITLKNWRR